MIVVIRAVERERGGKKRRKQAIWESKKDDDDDDDKDEDARANKRQREKASKSKTSFHLTIGCWSLFYLKSRQNSK